MTYKRKTAKEKLLDSKDLPKVVKIGEKMSKRWGTGTCVIPAPLEVDAIIKKIPKGKIITINRVREKLAKKHKTTIACPICTGIFASISAKAAEEDKEAGKKRITPWWRTLKGKGELNPKYPGGEKNQKKLLEKEGHKITQKGKKYFVEDYEKKLVDR